MADERSLSRLNGERAVSLLIRRQSGTNTVEVARAAKAALEELRQKLPAGYTMILADDTSKFIEHSIDDVKFDLIFGGLLAVAVIFLFLRNVTSTLITAVGHPDVDHRDLRLHQRARLHPQHHDDARAVAVDRHADRRRDRGHREHLPPHGRRACTGARPPSSAPRRSASRSWPPPFSHRGGVRAGRVHERHHRPLLLPVRHDGHVRRADLAVRVVHADADAVVALPQHAGAARADLPLDRGGAGRARPGLPRAARLVAPPPAGGRRRWRSSSSCRRLYMARFLGTEFLPQDDESQFSVDAANRSRLVARGDRRGRPAGGGDPAQEPVRAGTCSRPSAAGPRAG